MQQTVFKRLRNASLAIATIATFSSCGSTATTESVAAETSAAQDTLLTQTLPPTTESPVTAPVTTPAPATTPAPTPAPTQPPTPAPAPQQALMPEVVCMNLQQAQDYIQTFGVFYSRSEDATGRGRMQVLDSNWQVVGQYPAPGTPFGEGDAVLSVVKYGESPNPC